VKKGGKNAALLLSYNLNKRLRYLILDSLENFNLIFFKDNYLPFFSCIIIYPYFLEINSIMQPFFCLGLIQVKLISS